MSGDVAATITAIGGLVTAAGAICFGYWAYRGKERAAKAVEIARDLQAHLIQTDKGIFELGQRVDGRLSELLKVNREKADAEIVAARANGVAQGEQAQRDRSGSPQP